MKKTIIKNLLLAQIASDAGKGITTDLIGLKGADIAQTLNYKIKENFIIAAIAVIKKHPETGVKYHCKHTVYNDESGIERHELITFFEWEEEDNNKIQLSYHSKWWKTKLRGEVDTTPPIQWNGIVGGTRNNCLQLYTKYFK